MPTDNLSRLSRRLKSSTLGDKGGVFLFHSNYLAKTAALDPALRDQINGLISDIRAIVPTDFAFSLDCEFAGIRLMLELEDGDTGSMAGSWFFVSRRSMMAKLRSINWDKRRGELIKQSDIFEQMVSEADDRPPNIPSSKQAALRFERKLAVAIENVRSQSPVPEFVLIIAREDVGLGIEEIKCRDNIIFTIADRMTTECDILAVLERGNAWSFAEIEAAKLGAVEGLGPISRAKAERRFFA